MLNKRLSEMSVTVYRAESLSRSVLLFLRYAFARFRLRKQLGSAAVTFFAGPFFGASVQSRQLGVFAENGRRDEIAVNFNRRSCSYTAGRCPAPKPTRKRSRSALRSLRSKSIAWLVTAEPLLELSGGHG